MAAIGIEAEGQGNAAEDEALLALLHYLKFKDYRFVSVTPATHQLVLARATEGRRSLRDIFGWNRPFARSDLDPSVLGMLERAGLLAQAGGGWRTAVRVATLGSDLFLHSSFPTEARDAVFFGPDTYRFARFIADQLGELPPAAQIVDMGAGSGAGGIYCARLSPTSKVTLVDVNARALRYARLNAKAAGLSVDLRMAGSVPEGADLIVANPPYMIDRARREYRDGGDMFGGALALEWVRQALDSLKQGGRMLLYTGVAFVDGRSPALDAIAALSSERGAKLVLDEIDPDVFGEELSGEAYSEVERIAAVGCALVKPR